MSLNKFTDVNVGHSLGLHIGCSELKVGELTLPNTDGNLGDVIGTDGLGNLSFQAPLITTKDSITETEYALALSTGSIISTSSLYQENGSFVHIYGTLIIENLQSSSVVSGISTISLIITVPDTIIFPSTDDSIVFGSAGGYVSVLGVREICSTSLKRYSSNQVKIDFMFLGDLTVSANRFAFLSWSCIYEK